jgi:hypothetical protein
LTLPARRITIAASRGLVAQLVEQRIENPRVGGSIPPQATTPSDGSPSRRAVFVSGLSGVRTLAQRARRNDAKRNARSVIARSHPVAVLHILKVQQFEDDSPSMKFTLSFFAMISIV